ncbi:DNA repair protein rad2 [Podochytrium sp. JEL0797]|nr:DNA repair protein rad2 [Podochytrium sp. JEL0797]
MGVQGLWKLLEPAAETIALEQLAGQRVAVDASIWLFQFLKAMRDGEGNVVSGAHLRGFFVRICKLLFHGVKPVFVFDGATPPLKRATVRRRRERKTDAAANVERTAEKLLQQQLRLRALQNASPADSAKRPADPLQLPHPKKQVLDAYLLPPHQQPLQISSATDQRLLDPTDLSHFISQHLPSLANSVEDASLAGMSQDLQYQIILNLKTKSREANASRVLDLLEIQENQGVGAFSQAQINGLVRRNALTEKLYSVAKGEASVVEGVVGGAGRRMAGVRGKEYVLVKDETVGAGYTMKPAGAAASAAKESRPAVVKEEPVGPNSVNIERYMLTARNQPVNFGQVFGDASIDDFDMDEDDEVDAGVRIDVPEPRFTHGVGEDFDPLLSDSEDAMPLPRPTASTATSVRDILEFDSSDEEEVDELFVEVPTTTTPSIGVDSSATFRPSVESDEDEVFSRQQPPQFSNDPLFSESESESDFPPFTPAPKPSLKNPLIAGPKNLNKVSFANESKPVETSSFVSDDISPEQIMLMFADASAKSEMTASKPNPEVIVIDDDDVGPPSGLAALSMAATGHVGDDMSPEEIMRLFDQQEPPLPPPSIPSPASSSSTLAPKPPPPITTSPNPRPPSPPSKPQPFVSDSTTLSEIMSMFHHNESLINGSTSTYVPPPPPPPPVPPLPSGDSIFDHSNELTLLTPNWREAIPSAVDTNVPDALEAIEAAVHTPVDMIKAFQVRLLSRRDKLPATGFGEETSRGIDFVVGFLDAVVGFKETMALVQALAEQEAEEAVDLSVDAFETHDEAIDVEMLDVDPSDATHHERSPRSPSPTDSDSSGHSVRSLQARRSRLQTDPTASSPASPLEFEPEEDPSDAPLEFEHEEDLTDVPLASQHEDSEFLDFLNRARESGSAGLSNEVQTNIEKLISQNRREKRDAAMISSDMIRECQDLLRLFGIPFITAPQEAESQCAFLFSSPHGQAIIPDASDVVLFGGSHVYKNMFNSNKFVERYRRDHIAEQMGLQQQHLILLAYLLGSDYTEGIDGVGVVTGMELLNEFCRKDGGGNEESGDGGVQIDNYVKGLEDFKEWVISVQRGLDDKTEQSGVRKKFRSKAKNIELPVDFPNREVFAAYFRPEVNESMDPFQWGSPDIAGIRNFLDDKAGYPVRKSNEILIPVIHEMDKRLRKPSTQTRLDQFFTIKTSPSKISSNRLQNAVNIFKGLSPQVVAPAAKNKKRVASKRKPKADLSLKKPASKKSKKTKKEVEKEEEKELSSGTD